jgi:hypothetical protein
MHVGVVHGHRVPSTARGFQNGTFRNFVLNETTGGQRLNFKGTQTITIARQTILSKPEQAVSVMNHSATRSCKPAVADSYRTGRMFTPASFGLVAAKQAQFIDAALRKHPQSASVNKWTCIGVLTLEQDGPQTPSEWKWISPIDAYAVGLAALRYKVYIAVPLEHTWIGKMKRFAQHHPLKRPSDGIPACCTPDFTSIEFRIPEFKK